MIMALRVQCAMDHPIRQVVAELLVLRTRFGAHDRLADHDIGAYRLLHVDEGEYIGGIIASAKFAIQATPLGRAHNAQYKRAQYNSGVAFEREQYPAPQGRARWQGRKGGQSLDRKDEMPLPRCVARPSGPL